MKKAITLTILFEADALNRDEKTGNVLSIKKLTRGWGKTYPYISKYALRHYLFATLVKGSGWVPSPVRVLEEKGKKVVQFDLTSSNIISSAEMDIFGYMFTVGGELSITRKSPLGITKAIAYENWTGDMAFYANHDLAYRSNIAPIPVNREESKSLFKASFTLDLDNVGNEIFRIEDSQYDSDSKTLILFLRKGKEFNLEGLKESEDERGKIWKVEDEFEIWEAEGLIYFKPIGNNIVGDYNEEEGVLKINSDKIKTSKREKKEFINVTRIEKEGETIYFFPYLQFKPKEGKLLLGLSQTLGEVEEITKDKEYKLHKEVCLKNVEEIESEKKYKALIGSHTLIIEVKKENEKEKCYIQKKELGEIIKKDFKNGELRMVFNKEAGKIKIGGKSAHFILSQEEKKERIMEILNAIYNGLYYHSSGESPGIVPLFLIAGIIKVPIPVFHSFVDIEFYKQDCRPKFKVRENLLKNGVSNGWIENYDNGKRLIFIETREPEVLSREFIDENFCTNNWGTFIASLFK